MNFLIFRRHTASLNSDSLKVQDSGSDELSPMIVCLLCVHFRLVTCKLPCVSKGCCLVFVFFCFFFLFCFFFCFLKGPDEAEPRLKLQSGWSETFLLYTARQVYL